MSWKPDQKLYPYQQGAHDVALDTNVLLAFDMGTGKSPLSLSIIETLRDNGDICRTGIVLAPKSLLPQWHSQVDKFTDVGALIVAGTPDRRTKLYEKALVEVPGYLVMTYATYVADASQPSGKRRMPVEHFNDFMILDEATAIKSFKSQRAKVLKAHRDNYPVRIALSGTPIENGKLEELYSILDWVEPKVLGNFWSFEKKYVVRNDQGWVVNYKNLDQFHKVISGNVIRKKSSDPDVAKYMPKVIHLDPVEVKLDLATRKVYDLIANEILSDLDEMVAAMGNEKDPQPVDLAALYGEGEPEPKWKAANPRAAAMGLVQSKIQCLRMLLDSPRAVQNSATKWMATRGKDGSAYAADLDNRDLLTLTKTPKLDALIEYLGDFLESNPANKAVVFASFIDAVVDIDVRVTNELHVLTSMFTGSMSAKQREMSKRNFQIDPDTRVFISSDAGGYGLDLPQANLLINYDLPWQPGLLAQRNARLHRASSKWKHVIVQDIVADNTIELRLPESHTHKNALASAALEGENIAEDGSLMSSLDSLRSFLGDLAGISA